MSQDQGTVHDTEHDNITIAGRRTPISHFFDVKRDETGKAFIETWVRGIGLLRFVLLNKGSAFSYEERRALGIEGLLPTRVSSMSHVRNRIFTNLHAPWLAHGQGAP